MQVPNMRQFVLKKCLMNQLKQLDECSRTCHALSHRSVSDLVKRVLLFHKMLFQMVSISKSGRVNASLQYSHTSSTGLRSGIGRMKSGAYADKNCTDEQMR